MLQNESAEVVRTDVVVRTEPNGAMVSLNGQQMDAAPVRIPVEYEHVTQQWLRQSNYGASIRSGLDTFWTIVLFPVWAPASLIHGEQEMKRHVYNGQRHVVTAWARGFEPEDREIVLDGEDQVDVLLTLRPDPDAGR
jgi:hypothetical protein